MSPSPKHIAILYDCPYPFMLGGGQKRFFEIAKYLVTKGWRVDWYALKFWSGADQITHQGIRYLSIGKPVKLYNENGKRTLSEAFYYGLCTLKKFSLYKYDIIHAGQWPYFHLYPAMLYASTGKKSLVIDWWEVWGNRWHDYTKKFAICGQLLERISAHLSQHIIAITQQGRQQLITLGVKPKHIETIFNGIDYQYIQTIPADPQRTDFIYMGRLAAHKNVAHLLQALVIMRTQGYQSTLAIIGNGPEMSSLKRLSEQLDLTNQIKFYGAIPDNRQVFAKLKAASYFLHPSTKEGGGSITALEAQACGLPVIAYQHSQGLAKELITEGVNGFWVSPPTPKALANKLISLLNNKKILDKLQVMATVADCDWERIGECYHQYFLNLIGEKDARTDYAT